MIGLLLRALCCSCFPHSKHMGILKCKSVRSVLCSQPSRDSHPTQNKTQTPLGGLWACCALALAAFLSSLPPHSPPRPLHCSHTGLLAVPKHGSFPHFIPASAQTSPNWGLSLPSVGLTHLPPESLTLLSFSSQPFILISGLSPLSRM